MAFMLAMPMFGFMASVERRGLLYGRDAKQAEESVVFGQTGLAGVTNQEDKSTSRPAKRKGYG